MTVIASAAAAAMGLLAVPVYEIYKVGADPHWLDGLDLLGVLGLKVAVIPHYDNAEGGTHDTRFCYLGDRRLAVLERMLPADAAVLGVDEHTALVFDLAAATAEVRGRGGATVRKAGVSTVLPSGSVISLADLRALASTGTPVPAAAGRPPPVRDSTRNDPGRSDPASTDGAAPGAAGPAGRADTSSGLELPELTRQAEQRFDAAERARDGAAMVAAILDLEAAIDAWASDTDENDNADRARAMLRGLIARLGRAAESGLADPADRLRPLVDPLLTLRASLRSDGGYAAADLIRDALTAAGVRVRDSPDGTTWAMAESA